MPEIANHLSALSNARRVRFAEFEADFEQRELRRSGRRQPLQHKPFHILEMLLRRPGFIVTRQELAQELWPGLRVSFEKNLNTAVNSLRLALEDSPRNSRFIETRPGIGYRFIASVEPLERRSHPAQPLNLDAQQDCLRGRYFLAKLTGSDLHKAIAHFQSALRSAPDCGLACAGLAEAYCLLALQGGASAGDVCQQARSLASLAVESCDDLPEAHLSLAHVRMTFDWDWAGARQDCQRALELDPELAETHRCYATWLSAQGRHGDAEQSARRACLLDPLSLAAGITLAWSLYLIGDNLAAEQECWKLLTLEPRLSAAQTILGMVYTQKDEHSEAIIELENACRCSDGEPYTKAALAYALAAADRPDEARHLLNQLQPGRHACFLAAIYCGLGLFEQAMEHVERAIQVRDPFLIWLNVDPRLAPLRPYASFDRVVQRIGLPARELEYRLVRA